MIKIAVADDEQQERQTLGRCFQQLGREIREEIEIRMFPSGDDLLSEYDGSYDLICLDIDMPGSDGLTVAKEIRKRDRQVLLVFVTNLAQMAIRGYEVQAIDFLIKPVNYYSFAIKMQNMIHMIHQRKSRNIVLSTPEGMRIISTEFLYFAEVRGHYLFFHTTDGIIRQKATLKDLEEKLQGLSFQRCNQSYLINLKHVAAVKKDDVLVGQEWIKISRPRKKQFLQSLANYIGGVEF